jgi:putative nucleotidyltransferase with HDIG domain
VVAGTNAKTVRSEMPTLGEETNTVTVQGGDIPEVLKIGDVLRKPVYGRPLGATNPVLLLAQGQTIETIQQLQRLREAGFAVSMPHEAERKRGDHDRASAEPPKKQAVIPPNFAQRLDTAQHVRSALGTAVRGLFGLVSTGLTPDLREVLSASTLLATEVAADPQAVAALTHLRQCDDYTVEHSADVGILMVAIGRTMGMPDEDLRMLAMGGLLHDVGKQRLSLETLRKQGPLSPEEWVEVKKHPQFGQEILSQSMPECPESVVQVCVQHHERLDGSGYPYGLTKKDLHPHSLIAAVTDVFDATTAHRPYRRARAAREALMIVYGGRGTHFDPDVVTALIKLVGVYPVGTRVRLDSGECGVVLAPNPEDSTRPVVEIDTDRHGRPITAFHLSLKGATSRIVGTA